MKNLSNESKNHLIFLLQPNYPYCAEWDDDTWFMYICFVVYKSFFDKKRTFGAFLNGKIKREFKENTNILKKIEKIAYNQIKCINDFYKKD